MKFIVLNESFGKQVSETRRVIMPLDMIKFIQEGEKGNDTYLALRCVNEVGKQKYIFVKDTVDQIIDTKVYEWLP